MNVCTVVAEINDSILIGIVQIDLIPGVARGLNKGLIPSGIDAVDTSGHGDCFRQSYVAVWVKCGDGISFHQAELYGSSNVSGEPLRRRNIGELSLGVCVCFWEEYRMREINIR